MENQIAREQNDFHKHCCGQRGPLDNSSFISVFESSGCPKMHVITVSHSQHAHSLRITVLNNCVKLVGSQGISSFIISANRTEADW